MKLFLIALTLFSALWAPSQPAYGQAAPASSPPDEGRKIIADVRGAIAKQDFAGAEQVLRAFLKERGNTPAGLEALSWIGRGNLAAGRLTEAMSIAFETERLVRAAMTSTPLDSEPYLPIALGAAFEVQAQALGQQGQRSEGLRLLERSLEEFGHTSIKTRLQKNVNLLSLEGTPAPEYATAEFIGERPPALADLRGKTVLLFFWAHWCPDCKAMGPVLARLQETHRESGLVIVAPTQRYGYVAKRAKAEPAAEMAYMGEILQQSYGGVQMSVPVSAESFSRYGSSTTPTVVLVDRDGLVRLYHPGQMTYEQLEPKVRALIENRTLAGGQ
jgi:thiol-disulfide isomerase/thioredoxin